LHFFSADSNVPAVLQPIETCQCIAFGFSASVLPLIEVAEFPEPCSRSGSTPERNLLLAIKAGPAPLPWIHSVEVLAADRGAQTVRE